ncbi:MAG: SLBB domain-containing protein [Candidatus Eisenbacteria bacterium]
MRIRSFQTMPRLAAALRLGLFALALSGAAPASLAAAATTAAGDPGASISANASIAGSVDVPAFAGRVDPATYRGGPGDEFAFRSSDLLDPKILRVGPTGEIILPDAGSIVVAGLTLREMEARAREILRPFVRGKGFVLILHRPRRFRAVVVGDVNRPGAVLVQAPVRASDAIEAAGGVGGGGARRGIIVRRGTDSLWVDLVHFERLGDLSANPLVFETDVIVVPPRSRRVEISGAVAHPGWYDFVPGDRASTLITLAGGLQAHASDDRITLSREAAPGHRDEIAVAAPGAGGETDAGNPALEPGDRLFVPQRAHWREGARATILDEVALPGPYGIVDGVDRLGSLIARAGGFTAWADSTSIRIERSSDAAVRDSAFLRLAREQNVLVTADDRDYVVALTRERAAFSLPAGRGESSGRTWEKWMEIPLLDGDRIVVPRRSFTVMVQGEVKAPGHVPFEPSRGIGDYVQAAGGYTGRANKGRVRVTLASTGRAVSAGDLRELRAGDIIWVPAREPRNAWGIVRDVLATAAQAATVYLVAREATK